VSRQTLSEVVGVKSSPLLRADLPVIVSMSSVRYTF
jgi:hypothetical protein